MKVTSEIIDELNNAINSGMRFGIAITPQIHNVSLYRIDEPHQAMVIGVRLATEHDLEFLINFWWRKYSMKIDRFEYVIDVQYEPNGVVYGYPSTTVEVYEK